MRLNLKKIIEMASIVVVTSASSAFAGHDLGFLDVHHAADLQNAANNARWGAWSTPRDIMVYNVNILETPVFIKEYSYTPTYSYRDVDKGTVAHILAVDTNPEIAPTFYYGLEAAFVRHMGISRPAAGAAWSTVSGIGDDWDTVLGIKDNDGNSFLNVLAEYDNVRGLQACLALGMPLAKLSKNLGAYGNTPLCTAAAGRSNHFLNEAITKLGATDAKTALGVGSTAGTPQTPLELATSKSYTDTIAIIQAALT